MEYSHSLDFISSVIIPLARTVASVSFFDFVAGATFLIRTFIAFGFATGGTSGGNLMSGGAGGEECTRISGGVGGMKRLVGGGSGSRGID